LIGTVQETAASGLQGHLHRDWIVDLTYFDWINA
jgi:hypothetical protein